MKTMLGAAWHQSVIQRFRAEAEAVAALDYPNIVPIYEIVLKGRAQARPFFIRINVEEQRRRGAIDDHPKPGFFFGGQSLE